MEQDELNELTQCPRCDHIKDEFANCVLCSGSRKLRVDMAGAYRMSGFQGLEDMVDELPGAVRNSLKGAAKRHNFTRIGQLNEMLAKEEKRAY